MTAAPTPSPSPTPSPGPRALLISETGLGSYLETTVPVAVVRNLSSADVATRVAVHLRVTRGTSVVASADVPVSLIAPGSDVIVAARVAGSLRGDAVTAAAEVGAWVPQTTTTVVRLDATAVGVTCGGGCAGGGSGDLMATVHMDGRTDGITAAAVCRDASGVIVGGGSADHPGGPAGATVAVDVPVILSAPAARCRVTAVPSGF